MKTRESTIVEYLRLALLLAAAAGFAVSTVAFAFRWSDADGAVAHAVPVCCIPLFLASLYTASRCVLPNSSYLASRWLTPATWLAAGLVLLVVMLPGTPFENGVLIAGVFLSLFIVHWFYRQLFLPDIRKSTSIADE